MRGEPRNKVKQFARSLTKRSAASRQLARHYAGEELSSVDPSFDRSSLDDCTLNRALETVQRHRDATDEVVDLYNDAVNCPKERPTGVIVVGKTSNPVEATYSAEALQNLPGQSVRRVVITVAKLTREELEEVVRVVKPSGRIEWKTAEQGSAK